MDAMDETVVPGFEKFNTVQNVLDQNKCALSLVVHFTNMQSPLEQLFRNHTHKKVLARLFFVQDSDQRDQCQSRGQDS